MRLKETCRQQIEIVLQQIALKSQRHWGFRSDDSIASLADIDIEDGFSGYLLSIRFGS